MDDQRNIQFKYKIILKSAQRESSFSLRTDGRTDRQTEVMKEIVGFHNFVSPPKKR
jgi:hypothetical protein